MCLPTMRQGEAALDFAPAGASQLVPAFGQSTFLTGPGGRDYVGANSYDEKGDRTGEESS